LLELYSGLFATVWVNIVKN